jgi:ribose transport system ATP-binding protein
VKDMSIARDSIKMFGIKAQGTEGKITYLSGGNQQKVTLAKAMNTRPRILLLDEPTRGVDVNAKREIYAIISKLVEQGISVVMVSSELPEIFGISDRIMVMFEGRKTGEFINSEEHHENVMKALLGVAHYEE